MKSEKKQRLKATVTESEQTIGKLTGEIDNLCKSQKTMDFTNFFNSMQSLAELHQRKQTAEITRNEALLKLRPVSEIFNERQKSLTDNIVTVKQTVDSSITNYQSIISSLEAKQYLYNSDEKLQHFHSTLTTFLSNLYIALAALRSGKVGRAKDWQDILSDIGCTIFSLTGAALVAGLSQGAAAAALPAVIGSIVYVWTQTVGAKIDNKKKREFARALSLYDDGIVSADKFNHLIADTVTFLYQDKIRRCQGKEGVEMLAEAWGKRFAHVISKDREKLNLINQAIRKLKITFNINNDLWQENINYNKSFTSYAVSDNKIVNTFADFQRYEPCKIQDIYEKFSLLYYEYENNRPKAILKYKIKTNYTETTNFGYICFHSKEAAEKFLQVGLYNEENLQQQTSLIGNILQEINTHKELLNIQYRLRDVINLVESQQVIIKEQHEQIQELTEKLKRFKGEIKQSLSGKQGEKANEKVTPELSLNTKTGGYADSSEKFRLLF